MLEHLKDGVLDLSGASHPSLLWILHCNSYTRIADDIVTSMFQPQALQCYISIAWAIILTVMGAATVEVKGSASAASSPYPSFLHLKRGRPLWALVPILDGDLIHSQLQVRSLNAWPSDASPD
jgi:hypothetical protein